MKVRIFPTIIALAISSLIVYCLYSFQQSPQKLVYNAICFIMLATSLICSVGVNFGLTRTTSIIRVVSILFTVVALTSNIIFTVYPGKMPIFITTNGIMFLLYTLVVYAIYRAKQ